MMLSLINVADRGIEDETTKSYWNTYYCQSRVYTANDKLYGKYCKNRFCTLCCSIRKAEIINKYLPVIRTWPEPYFVTLTAKAVSFRALKRRMKDTIKGFRIITSRYRKRNQRGSGIKLMGIKSLECNFNSTKKTYNPHLHLIVPNKKIADAIISEWLKLCTISFARPVAQNKKRVNDREKALIEIVKYGSKIFTEPDANNKGNAKIHAAALDNIFKTMKGLRIFERFGFNLPKGNGIEKICADVIQQYDEWVFQPKYFDWLNTESERRLSDYKPLPQLINLLENNIETKLQ